MCGTIYGSDLCWLYLCRFIANDLANVDRTLTPWVVVGAHRPLNTGCHSQCQPPLVYLWSSEEKAPETDFMGAYTMQGFKRRVQCSKCIWTWHLRRHLPAVLLSLHRGSVRFPGGD